MSLSSTKPAAQWTASFLGKIIPGSLRELLEQFHHVIQVLGIPGRADSVLGIGVGSHGKAAHAVRFAPHYCAGSILGAGFQRLEVDAAFGHPSLRGPCIGDFVILFVDRLEVLPRREKTLQYRGVVVRITPPEL